MSGVALKSIEQIYGTPVAQDHASPGGLSV